MEWACEGSCWQQTWLLWQMEDEKVNDVTDGGTRGRECRRQQAGGRHYVQVIVKVENGVREPDQSNMKY